MSGFFGEVGGGGYITLPPTDAPTTVPPPTTAPPTCAPFQYQTEPPTCPPETQPAYTGIEQHCTWTGLLSGGTNTKGNWVNLGAAAHEYAGIIVEIMGDVTANTFALVDIGVGAGPTVKVADIPWGGTISGARAGCKLFFPLHIESGQAIQARAQCTAASKTPLIAVSGVMGHEHSIDNILTLGAVEASSSGLQVDPGESAGAKGAYSVLTASLAESCKWLGWAICLEANTARTDCSWQMDIATGANGAEVPFITNFNMLGDSVLDTIYPWAFGMFPKTLAQGTRLTARAACSITDATDRLFGIIAFAGY